MKELLESCCTVLGIEITDLGKFWKIEKNKIIDYVSKDIELPELRIKIQLFFRDVVKENVKREIGENLLKVLNLHD